MSTLAKKHQHQVNHHPMVRVMIAFNLVFTTAVSPASFISNIHTSSTSSGTSVPVGGIEGWLRWRRVRPCWTAGVTCQLTAGSQPQHSSLCSARADDQSRRDVPENRRVCDDSMCGILWSRLYRWVISLFLAIWWAFLTCNLYSD